MLLKLPDNTFEVSDFSIQLSNLLVLCLDIGLKSTLSRDELCILRSDLIDFLSLRFVLVELSGKHVDLSVLVL